MLGEFQETFHTDVSDLIQSQWLRDVQVQILLVCQTWQEVEDDSRHSAVGGGRVNSLRTRQSHMSEHSGSNSDFDGGCESERE